MKENNLKQINLKTVAPWLLNRYSVITGWDRSTYQGSIDYFPQV